MGYAREAAASSAPARSAGAAPRRAPLHGRLEQLAKLQQSAGNAAVGTLMREPHDGKQAHKETALEHAQVTGATRVKADDLGNLVQAVLTQSSLLAPYVKGKLDTPIFASGVTVHGSDAEFDGAYVKINKIKDNLSSKDVQNTIAQVGGFFDKKTRTIHLRSRSDFGDALHEALHKLSSPSFYSFYDTFTNEGATAYLTDLVLGEQGQAPHKDLYRDQAACARKVAEKVGFDVVAQSYFSSTSVLLDTLTKKLKVDPGKVRELSKSSALCDGL